MHEREALLGMLRQLLEDMLAIQQAGAGYYSCVPMIRRYNKLLAQSRKLFEPEDEGLISTFDELEELDPNDPAEKMKVIQGIRVEIGQLISLLITQREQEKDEQPQEAE